jgi:hypothetical protein
MLCHHTTSSNLPALGPRVLKFSFRSLVMLKNAITKSLYGFATDGVCHANLLPNLRCALTAPFHPYHNLKFCNSKQRGGLLSVALIRQITLPRNYLASCFSCSSDFPPPFFEGRDHPTNWPRHLSSFPIFCQKNSVFV